MRAYGSSGLWERVKVCVEGGAWGGGRGQTKWATGEIIDIFIYLFV